MINIEHVLESGSDILIFKDKRLIRQVTFLPTIQDPDTVSKKTIIVDILCKDDLGELESKLKKSRRERQNSMLKSGKIFQREFTET